MGGGTSTRRDPRETGKYELWANIGKQRTLQCRGSWGWTGEALMRGLDMGRDRKGAHGGTGSLGKMNEAGEGGKSKGV